MAGKKKIPGRQTNQNKQSPLSPGPMTSAKHLNSDQPFWKSTNADQPRLYSYQKICIFLVAFLVFANGIKNGFNLDDIYYTTPDNPISNMGIKAIPEIFTTRTLHDPKKNNFDYRPIPMLSFALQHQLLGDSASMSHFINVFIYSVVCVLTFVLLCLWFGRTRSWFAFLVTLLYAVHPLHTEVVDNIKNRDELLAAIFILLTLKTIWKWHLTNKNTHLITSAFLFISGMMCKSTIVVYLPIIPFAFYFFTAMKGWKIILPSAILMAIYMLINFTENSLLPVPNRVFSFYENPMFTSLVPWNIKTATSSYILGWYAYLHVIPYPLSFYYGYQYVKLVNWTSLFPVVSLMGYLLLIYFIIRNFKKKSIAAFGAVFYLICLFIYSNLMGAAPGMMAERFTFDSSLGYCILLVSIFYYLFNNGAGFFQNIRQTKYLFPAFLIFFISYALMTIARNKYWEDNLTLYNHDMQHLQKSIKANMLYGDQLILKHDYYKTKFNNASGPEKQEYRDSMLLFRAEEKLPYKQILELDPDNDNALNNLGVAYIHDDSFEMAKKYLLLASNLKSGKTDDVLHYNLGLVYGDIAIRDNNIHLMDSSIIEFKTVISLNPKYANAYWRSNLLYLMKGDTSAAINALEQGINNLPDMSFLYIELAKVYLYKRDTARGISYYEKSAAVSNPDPTIFPILENYYRANNNAEKETYYRNKELNINANRRNNY